MLNKVNERYWIKEIITILILLAFIFGFNSLTPLLQKLTGVEKQSVEWSPLYKLTLEYLQVVILSSTLSFVIAFLVGSFVHLYQWESLKLLCLSIGSFSTTFPTIAVIAILVPYLGYGFKPVFVGLVIYGIFPILNSTVKGYEQIDPLVNKIAIGMGMTRFQKLLQIEIPLSLPTIMAGVKTSIIINIAATTVGAVVGAGGLGMPIVSGIRTNNPLLLLKGAIPVALIAIFTQQLFKRLEKSIEWRKA